MLEVKFKKRYRDFNKGDTLEVTDQKILTRLLRLDAIEFPGQTRLVKPTPKGAAKKAPVKKKPVAKKPSGSVSKPKTKTAKKTAKSSG